MHGWPRKCTHHFKCCSARTARCTHFVRHQPAYSQFSCVSSVKACLFSTPTCGCVRLYALKLLACCAWYSTLRRSLPHLTRVALLTAMRSRPLCTTRAGRQACDHIHIHAIIYKTSSMTVLLVPLLLSLKCGCMLLIDHTGSYPINQLDVRLNQISMQ